MMLKNGEQAATDLDAFTTALSMVRVDVAASGALFAALANGAQADFEAIRGLSYECCTPGQLTEGDRVQILAIARQNNQQYPVALRPVAEKGLQKLLTCETARIHIIRHNADIAAFVRIEPQGEKDVYLGSWNSREEAKGLVLGEALLRLAVRRENASATIHLHSWDKNKPSRTVVERLGFRPDAEIHDYDGSGETLVSYVLPAGRYRK